jgi:hypothetical protein
MRMSEIALILSLSKDEAEEGYATPSFFCKDEEDVVYWKRSFSFGRQIWNDACAISAASWKPDRISFNLPA